MDDLLQDHIHAPQAYDDDAPPPANKARLQFMRELAGLSLEAQHAQLSPDSGQLLGVQFMLEPDFEGLDTRPSQSEGAVQFSDKGGEPLTEPIDSAPFKYLGVICMAINPDTLGDYQADLESWVAMAGVPGAKAGAAAKALAQILKKVNPATMGIYGPMLDSWAAQATGTDLSGTFPILAQALKLINPAMMPLYGPLVDLWSLGVPIDAAAAAAAPPEPMDLGGEGIALEQVQSGAPAFLLALGSMLKAAIPEASAALDTWMTSEPELEGLAPILKTHLGGEEGDAAVDEWLASGAMPEGTSVFLSTLLPDVAGPLAAWSQMVALSTSVGGPDALAPVQAKGGSAGDTSSIHTAAAEGVKGSGGQLPHLDRIQQSFGVFDVSSVESYVGGSAGQANKSMGSLAYATGNKVAFKSSPDLHTAAHEAAHVVQQRAGVSLPGGVGQVGDSYEKHADAVADRVVRGQSAADLLGGATGGGSSGVQRALASGQTVQRKTTGSSGASSSTKSGGSSSSSSSKSTKGTSSSSSAKGSSSSSSSRSTKGTSSSSSAKTTGTSSSSSSKSGSSSSSKSTTTSSSSSSSTSSKGSGGGGSAGASPSAKVAAAKQARTVPALGTALADAKKAITDAKKGQSGGRSSVQKKDAVQFAGGGDDVEQAEREAAAEERRKQQGEAALAACEKVREAAPNAQNYGVLAQLEKDAEAAIEACGKPSDLDDVAGLVTEMETLRDAATSGKEGYDEWGRYQTNTPYDSAKGSAAISNLETAVEKGLPKLQSIADLLTDNLADATATLKSASDFHKVERYTDAARQAVDDAFETCIGKHGIKSLTNDQNTFTEQAERLKTVHDAVDAYRVDPKPALIQGIDGAIPLKEGISRLGGEPEFKQAKFAYDGDVNDYLSGFKWNHCQVYDFDNAASAREHFDKITPQAETLGHSGISGLVASIQSDLETLERTTKEVEDVESLPAETVLEALIRETSRAVGSVEFLTNVRFDKPIDPLKERLSTRITSQGNTSKVYAEANATLAEKGLRFLGSSVEKLGLDLPATVNHLGTIVTEIDGHVKQLRKAADAFSAAEKKAPRGTLEEVVPLALAAEKETLAVVERFDPARGTLVASLTTLSDGLDIAKSTVWAAADAATARTTYDGGLKPLTGADIVGTKVTALQTTLESAVAKLEQVAKLVEEMKKAATSLEGEFTEAQTAASNLENLVDKKFETAITGLKTAITDYIKGLKTRLSTVYSAADPAAARTAQTAVAGQVNSMEAFVKEVAQPHVDTIDGHVKLLETSAQDIAKLPKAAQKWDSALIQAAGVADRVPEPDSSFFPGEPVFNDATVWLCEEIAKALAGHADTNLSAHDCSNSADAEKAIADNFTAYITRLSAHPQLGKSGTYTTWRDALATRVAEDLAWLKKAETGLAAVQAGNFIKPAIDAAVEPAAHLAQAPPPNWHAAIPVIKEALAAHLEKLLEVPTGPTGGYNPDMYKKATAAEAEAYLTELNNTLTTVRQNLILPSATAFLTACTEHVAALKTADAGVTAFAWAGDVASLTALLQEISDALEVAEPLFPTAHGTLMTSIVGKLSTAWAADGLSMLPMQDLMALHRIKLVRDDPGLSARIADEMKLPYETKQNEGETREDLSVKTVTFDGKTYVVEDAADEKTACSFILSSLEDCADHELAQATKLKEEYDKNYPRFRKGSAWGWVMKLMRNDPPDMSECGDYATAVTKAAAFASAMGGAQAEALADLQGHDAAVRTYLLTDRVALENAFDHMAKFVAKKEGMTPTLAGKVILTGGLGLLGLAASAAIAPIAVAAGAGALAPAIAAVISGGATTATSAWVNKTLIDADDTELEEQLVNIVVGGATNAITFGLIEASGVSDFVREAIGPHVTDAQVATYVQNWVEGSGKRAARGLATNWAQAVREGKSLEEVKAKMIEDLKAQMLTGGLGEATGS